MKQSVEADGLGKWYQTINIDGKLTKGCPGKGDVEKTWEYIRKILPKTLEGMRILDLGCNAGAYCVKSILMGAEEVVGIEANDHYFKQALFVKECMEKKHNREMNIRYIHGRIHEHIGGLGAFDIVYAFSILYHIRRSHIHDVCGHMARNTKNIIARFRSPSDISRYSGIFEGFGFRICKQFEEHGLFGEDKIRKKFLIRFIKDDRDRP